MFKYNQSSLICNFIQNLLRTNYVPTIPIYSTADYASVDALPAGCPCIYNNKIYSSNKKCIGEWELGKRYPNLTTNYISVHDYYSSELHEHLGEYLRAYSHFYKIDLMAFYNCFSNRLISDMSLPLKKREEETSGGGTENQSTKDILKWYEAGPASPDKYRITCFPIKPNTEYEIKIYSRVGGSILVQPLFYNGSSFLNILEDSEVLPSQTFPAKDTFTYIFNLQESSSSDPGDRLSRIINNLKYLYLFVQVPMVSGDLQISVIEKSPYFNTINKRLLNLDVDYNVPFSDRLLEYLTGNVIARNDSIKQNISRIQAIITSQKFKDTYMSGSSFIKDGSNLYEVTPSPQTKEITEIPVEPPSVPPYNNISASDKKIYTPVRGIYDNNMRLYLYDALLNAMANKKIDLLYDFNGYVDKDVEKLLMEIVSKDTIETRKKEGEPGILEKKLLEI